MGFRAVLLALLCAFATPAADPTPPRTSLETGLPLIRNFSPKEFGAASQNWAIVQDHRGVIFVGNHEGVLEFDGVCWRLIPVANKTTVRSLAVDAAGRVYVGAVGELGVLEPDSSGLLRYTSWLDRLPPEDRNFTDVWQTHATKDGILFSTFYRIFRVGSRVEVWRTGTSFHRAYQVGERLLVREEGRGLLELQNSEWRLVPGGERFKDEKIYAMVPGKGTGVLIIGTRAQGLATLEGASNRPFHTEVDAALKRDLLYAGIPLVDGTLALGTIQGGVYLLDAQGRLQGNLAKTDGLQDSAVVALTQDREGGLWLGLNKGLARTEAGPISFFGDRNGLEGGVMSLHRHEGTLYAGTQQGLFKLEASPKTRARFRPLPGIKGQTWAFLDWGSRLLVANFFGVYELREGKLSLLRPSASLSKALVRSELEPSRVFVGLQDGLASLRFDRGRWEDEGKVPGITENISSLREMSDGRLWAGTRSEGLLRLTFPAGWKGGAAIPAPHVERFGITEGLPSLSETRVYRFGNAPIFANHQGIYGFDDATHRFSPEPRFNPLFPGGPRGVEALYQDIQGRIWMHAMDEAREVHEVGAAVPQPDGTYRWQAAPPLPFTAINIYLNTWADPDGVIWFGTMADGLFRYDPHVSKDFTKPFQALVRKVATRSGQLLFGGIGPAQTPALKFADNALRFEFAATSFDSLEASRFQVLLEGVDRDWSTWSAEAYRDYTNLRERSYRFRVRAKNVYGTLSQEGVYHFRILPPWYRTLGAYLAYLLAAGAAAFGGLRWRMGRLEREKQVLEALVQERTRSLEESYAQALSLETQRAKAEAEAKAKSEFLANMSHEIRTPMNAVIGFAHLGLKLNLEARPRDYFQKIGNAAKSLLGIINDILDFTKIEAGKLEMEAVPFRLTDVLHQVADLLSTRAQEKGVELLVSVGEGVPRSLVGDPLRLGQVLMNLVTNAIKFTEKGQVLIKVSEARVGDGRILLRFLVKDSGIGIGPEALERLFQAFTQADTSTTRRFGGTGLGLVISQRLVGLMGGEIEVESKAGAGSTFTFTAEFQAADVQPEPHRGLRPELWGLRVLVVDDNATARQVFHEQVRSLGFEVSSVASGMEALMELERVEGIRPYDLVLMDWRLEGVDGVETARRIHKNVHLDHVPTILLMTAYGREEAMRHAEHAGIQGFISKPVNPDLLMEAILEAMGRGQAPVAIPKEPEAASVVQNLLAGARILLAEDNPINQEVATEILAGAGIHVDVAGNGVQAVNLAAGKDYDAILMDVQMPEMDGLQATTRIREQPRNRNLPIIAMTAHAMAGYREECLAAGMDDYITKPIDPQALFETLGRWIKGREPVSQTRQLQSPMAVAPIDPTGAFDVPAGLRRVGGNQAFYLRLVGGFATDFAHGDQEIRGALEAGDLAKAEHLAHTVKGVAGNLSALELAQAAGPLETALRERDAAAARTALPAFEAALARALASAPKLADLLAPPPQPASLPEDRPVEGLLQELETRLGQGDPRAEDTWKALAATLHGKATEAPLRGLGECLDAFDFKGAAAALNDLREALKKNSEGGT